MLTKIAIVVLVGMVASQGVPDDRCPATNPRPPVHLPHDTDCNIYWLCHFGEKYELKCPEGQHFDLPSSICVPAGSADCKGTSITTTITTDLTTTPPIASPDPDTTPTTVADTTPTTIEDTTPTTVADTTPTTDADTTPTTVGDTTPTTVGDTTAVSKNINI